MIEIVKGKSVSGENQKNSTRAVNIQSGASVTTGQITQNRFPSSVEVSKELIKNPSKMFTDQQKTVDALTRIPSTNYNGEFAKAHNNNEQPSLAERLVIDSAKRKQTTGQELSVSEMGALLKNGLAGFKRPENASQAFNYSKNLTTQKFYDSENAILASEDFSVVSAKGRTMLDTETKKGTAVGDLFRSFVDEYDSIDGKSGGVKDFLQAATKDYNSVNPQKTGFEISDKGTYENIKEGKGIYAYMTEKEKSIYFYFIGKEDNKEARNYLQSKMPELESRKAVEVAENSGFVKNTAIAASAGFENALTEMARAGVSGGMAAGLPMNDPLKQLLDPTYEEKLYTKISQNSYDKNYVYGLWLDAVNNITAQIPEAIMGYAGGQGAYILGLAQKMIGSSTTEAINEGEEAAKGVIKGCFMTALEVAPDYLFGGTATMFDNGALGKTKLTSKIINAIDNTFTNKKAAQLFAKAVTVVTSQTGEGIEEFFQELAEPVVNNLIYGWGETIDDETLENAVKSFLIGFFSTAPYAIGGANKNISDAYLDVVGADLKNVAGVKSVLDLAVAIENNSSLYYEVKSEYEAGRDVENSKIALLYQESVDKFLKFSALVRNSNRNASNNINNILDKKVTALIKQAKNYTQSKHNNPDKEKPTSSQQIVSDSRRIADVTARSKQALLEKISVRAAELLQTVKNGGIITDDDIGSAGGNGNGRLYNERTVGRNAQEPTVGENVAGTETASNGSAAQVRGNDTGRTQGNSSQIRQRRTVDYKNSSVNYTEAAADNSNGFRAYSAFKNAGIKAVYCDGAIERTVGGETVTRTEAFVAPDGTVFVSNMSTLPAKETFDHERVHIEQRNGSTEYSEYESELYFNADLNSETYLDITNQINKNQFNGKYDVEDINTATVFMREVAAYINQYVLSDPEYAERLFGGMFTDWNTVVEAVHKFNEGTGAEFDDTPTDTDGQNGGIINDTIGKSVGGRYTPEQRKAAVLRYKSGESYNINAKMREDVPLDEAEQEFVDTLDEALSQLPTYEGMVYRNLTFDDFGGEEAYNEFLKEYIPDEPIFYRQFISCSKAEDGYPVAGNFKVQLVIESKSARDVDGYGNNMESEVIYPLNSAFIVDGIDKSGAYPVIYLQEVSNNGYYTTEEQGETVRELQKPYTANGDLQGISAGNTMGNTGRSVRPQSAASERQRDIVRTQGGQGTVLSAARQEQGKAGLTDHPTDERRSGGAFGELSDYLENSNAAEVFRIVQIFDRFINDESTERDIEFLKNSEIARRLLQEFEGEISEINTTDTESAQERDTGDPLFRDPRTQEIYRPWTREDCINHMAGRTVNSRMKQVEDLTRKLGMNLRWIESAKKGYYEKETNTIALNPYLPLAKMYIHIYKHEFCHRLESKKLYNSFFRYVYDDSIQFKEYCCQKYAKDTGREFEGTDREVIEWAVKETEERYKRGLPLSERKRVDEYYAKQELLADFVGEVLLGGQDIESTMEALTELAEKNRTVFEQLRDFIRELIAKIKGDPHYITLEQDLDYLDNYIERVYHSTEIKNTAAKDNGVRYSIKKSKSGNKYVKVENKVVSNTDSAKDIAIILSQIIKTKYKDWIDVFGQKIGVNGKTERKWRKSKDAQYLYTNETQKHIDKMNAFNNADELLKAVRNYVGKRIKHERKDNFVEFARGVVDFKVDDRGYSSDIIVATTKSGAAVLYDIVGLQEIEIEDASHTAQDRRAETSSIDIISENDTSVNTNSTQKKGDYSEKVPQRKYILARERGLDAIAKAEKMERENASRGDIFLEMGLVRDPKGIWLYDIDDSKMQFYPNGDAIKKDDPDYIRYLELEKIIDSYGELPEDENGDLIFKEEGQKEVYEEYMYYNELIEKRYDRPLTLRDYIVHDELFEKYPQLAKTFFCICDLKDKEVTGKYSRKYNAILINEKLFKGEMKGEQIEDTIVHEIQHAVQYFDKRQGGISSQKWKSLRDKYGYLPYSDYLKREYKPKEAYSLTAGEIEADFVESVRSLPSPIRRFATPELGWGYALYPEDIYGSVKK